MEQFKPSPSIEAEPSEDLKNPEVLATPEVAFVELHSLKPHESVTISPEHPYSEINITPGGEKVAAVISVAEEDMYILQTDPSSPYNRYTTPYLLVDEHYMANPNSDHENKHYKGIWPNRPLTVGRSHNKERFNHYNTLSREQFVLEATEDGLTINNLNPSNETQVTGNILVEKEPAPVDDYNYIADYTQFLEIGRQEAPDGYGPSTAEAIYGTYLNHPIIGRNSETLRNGVYFTNTTEALLIDSSSFYTYATVNTVVNRTNILGANATVQEKLSVINQDVATLLRYDLDRVNEISTPYFKNNDIIGLSTYIEKGVGVCRHQAALAGLIIEEMISRGKLDGTVGLERNMRFKNDNSGEGGGHAWSVFRPSNRIDAADDYIVDPAQGFVGTRAQAVREGRWRYTVD